MKGVCFTPSCISGNAVLAEVPRYGCVNNLCARRFVTTGGKTGSRSHSKPLDGLRGYSAGFERVCIYPLLNRAPRRLCSAAALQEPECLETPGPFGVMHDRKENTAQI